LPDKIIAACCASDFKNIAEYEINLDKNFETIEKIFI
jgi:hypothetical protein